VVVVVRRRGRVVVVFGFFTVVVVVDVEVADSWSRPTKASAVESEPLVEFVRTRS
jgi:hypothetical protein